MTSFFDKAANQLSGIQGQFSAIQGSVTDTLLAAKSDVEANAGKIKDLLSTAPQVIDSTTKDIQNVGESAGKIQGEFSDLLNKAPEVIDRTTRDIRVQAEATASSTAETAKTEVNNIAAFFAGILEKCCAPFNKKKD